jgi:hypothetical protein
MVPEPSPRSGREDAPQPPISPEVRFSIFIPVWNDMDWLPGAIESVLAQTASQWELVIGDNASTDDLAAIVKRYADPRIRYHRWPTHRPVHDNWNRTLTLCRYEWLQPLSADDRLHSRCVERLGAAIQEAQSRSPRRLAAAVAACRHVGPDGRSAEADYYGSQPLMRVRGGLYDAAGWLRVMTARESTGTFPWQIGSVAWAREVVSEMGSFLRPDVGPSADNELLLRSAAFGDVVYVPEPLLDYTVRMGSDSSVRFVEHRAAGEAATPMGLAYLSALQAHEARRTVTRGERSAVLAAVARTYLQRAGQHRLRPGGRGRPSALVDILRAWAVSPRTVMEPFNLITALGAVLAPRGMVRWGYRYLSIRRRRSSGSVRI